MAFCILQQLATIFMAMTIVLCHTNALVFYNNNNVELPRLRQQQRRNVFGFGSFILKQSLSNKPVNSDGGKKGMDEKLHTVPYNDNRSLIRHLLAVKRDFLIGIRAMGGTKRGGKRSEPPIGMWGRDASSSRETKYKTNVIKKDIRNIRRNNNNNNYKNKRMNEEKEYETMNKEDLRDIEKGKKFIEKFLISSI